MVYRIYVEKKPGFDGEARQLQNELTTLLGIRSLTGLRLLNRYDVEGISEELFRQCAGTVFSEPPVDDTCSELPAHQGPAFAVEYLPGQFDQRADSAAECIQLISQGERPLVRSAKVYLLEGALTDGEVEEIKKYVINPVEAREASLETRATLQMTYAVPGAVATLTGFNQLDEAGLKAFIAEKGLAMDYGDIKFCQDYFRSEQRDPTITEIRMIDTYWSDHCRHTTFGTILDDVQIDDAVVQEAFDRYMALREETGRTEKPRCLMDVATMGARALKQRGVLTNLDESDEINACTVKIKCDVDGEDQDWLFLFKNETHNHPTEIEPFGGAATCIGGAIRDPLSGRSYVYQAMRVTGAGDPLVPVSETLPGKLPQRKLVTTAAAGYSSYGNQIGLATGQVDEIYHPGYVAKRMEIGAVVGATPASHVRRECPAPGDVIVLLGGRTGRDGIGGATGSSKAHNHESLEHCGAEVQKGNPPIERKLQRLFRREDACRMIKRCNDFGAGGVSVAIGELADGLYIDLNKVTKKYEGLDGTELAISESQERMAVALAPEDVDRFIALASEENLEATPVATVTEEKRLKMVWNGAAIVDVSRDFLNSNGAEKHQKAHIEKASVWQPQWAGATFGEKMKSMVGDLNICSKKGLSERFDSTIGAATVLMPFGGSHQLTPQMAMAAKLPVDGETTTCSGMAWGFNPYLMSADPYKGAMLAVVDSVTKLVAAGFRYQDMYLTFQEYFERLGDRPERWGKPLAALLGALDAQMGLGIASIGGKDSMSGSFEDLDVPPTLVSFATAIGKTHRVVSTEFKKGHSSVVLLRPFYKEDGVDPQLCFAAGQLLHRRPDDGKGHRPVRLGGGVRRHCRSPVSRWAWATRWASDDRRHERGRAVRARLRLAGAGDSTGRAGRQAAGRHHPRVPVHRLRRDPGQRRPAGDLGGQAGAGVSLPQGRPRRGGCVGPDRPACSPQDRGGKARVIIPVFPGTNCEYDTARRSAPPAPTPQTLVIRNLTPADVTASCEALVKAIDDAQIVMLPGGFSGGDEPDGSAKFIASFFRSPAVTDAVRRLLCERDGLMLGICNGFQALIKLGPCPLRRHPAHHPATAPPWTFNTIGRHQSMLGAHPGGLHRQPLAQPVRAGGRVPRPHQPRRGPLCGPAGRAGPAGRPGPDRDPVCGPGQPAHHGPALQSQRLPAGHRGHHQPRRPHSWARWAIRSAGATACTRTWRGTSSSPSLRAAWTTSASDARGGLCLPACTRHPTGRLTV